MRVSLKVILAAYLVVGILFAGTIHQLDLARCRDPISPAGYAFVAGVWPLFGGVLTTMSLFSLRPVSVHCTPLPKQPKPQKGG